MKRSVQSLLRAVKTTVSNIRSNNQIFWVSIVTITVAFSIIGLFLVIFVNLNSFLETWNNQVQMVIYLEDDITPAQRKSLETLLADNPDVERSEYVSKKAAWNKFKTTFSSKADFLQDLDFNPLPASYNVGFHQTSDRLDKIKGVAERLSGLKGIESLDYGAQWISGFEKFMIFSRFFLLAVGSLVGLGLTLIIANTIRLSFYSRRDEVELMLLIGATPGVVKTPFLLEGICQGFLGSALALCLIKAAHLYIESQFFGSLDSMARGLDFHFLSQSHAAILILGGVGIGWLGSQFSVNKILQREIK